MRDEERGRRRADLSPEPRVKLHGLWWLLLIELRDGALG